MKNDNNIPSPNGKIDSKLVSTEISNPIVMSMTKALNKPLFEVCTEVNVSINAENATIEPDTGLFKAERIKIGINFIPR